MARFHLSAQLRLTAPSAANTQSVLRQVNSQLSKGVTINVQLNTKGTQQQLNNLTKSLNNTRAASAASADSMEEFGKQAARSIRHFGAFTVATTAFISLIGAIRKGVSDAIEFDRQMVRIAQVTNSNVANLQSLRKEIDRVAKSTGVAAATLAEVSVTLAQAGISARDVAKAVDTLAKTELAATFGDISDTTEATIAIMRQFGVQADQLEQKLGSVNRVSAAFAVEAEDITAAVTRAGGSFSAAGGNFEEFIALLTSVRQTTRASAESISTGFNTIFARLQRFRTQDSLEKLGIQLRFTTEEAKKLGDVGLENQFVGPFEAVKRLSDALTRLRGSDPRFAQIVEELGGYRQIRNVIPLIQQFGVSQKALNIAVAGGNSLSKDAAFAQQALAVQIAKVREEFSALIRKISENQGFKAMVNTILKMASAAIKLVDALEPLLPMLVAFGGFSAGRSIGKFSRSFKENVFKFNSGGLVPGGGPNKDTVPATLTRGEYVLKRSAVKQIGVDRLQAMNEGRLGFLGGSGGKSVEPVLSPDKLELYNAVMGAVGNEGKSGDRTQKAIQALQNRGIDATQLSLPKLGTALNAKKADFLRQKAFAAAISGPISKKKKSAPRKSITLGSVSDPVFGGYFLRGNDKQNQTVTTEFKKGKSPAEFNAMIDTLMRGNPAGAQKLRGVNSIRVPLVLDTINKQTGQMIHGRMKKGFANLITSVAEKIGKPLKGPYSKNFDRLPLDSIAGAGFEGVIASFEKEPFTGKADATQTFDFPSGQHFPELFPNAKPGVIRDAKLSKSASAVTGSSGSIREKVRALLSGRSKQVSSTRFAKFNKGGLSKDTVPAMLSPGEYVINKKAADRIGINNLERMNNVQHFNRGGQVKKYATGGTVRPEQTGGFAGEAFNTFALLSVLETLVMSFGELEGTVKETVDTFSAVAIQFVALKSVLGELPFEKIADKALRAGDGLDTVGRAGLNTSRGIIKLARTNRGTKESRAIRARHRKEAGGLFRDATEIGDFDTAGNAFAGRLGLDKTSRLGRGAAGVGRGVSRIMADPVLTGKSRLQTTASVLSGGYDPSQLLGSQQKRFNRGSKIVRQAKNVSRTPLGIDQYGVDILSPDAIRANRRLKLGRAIQRRAVGNAIGGAVKGGFGKNSIISNMGRFRSADPLAREAARFKVGSSLKFAGGVGLAGTLAAGAITDLRESNARKRIASGDTSGGRAALEAASSQGGLAQGAIGGAAAGFVVGGPIGAAVGAVAGAGLAYATEVDAVNDVLRDLSGGLIDLQTSAEKAAGAVDQYEIGKRSEKISANVKAFGMAGSASERSGIAKDIMKDFSKNVRGTLSEDEDTAKAAQESLSNNAGDLRSVFEKALTSGEAKSVNDLSKMFGEGTTSALSELARIEGIDLSMIIREFNTLGETAARASKVQAAYTAAQLEAQRQMLKIRDFNTAMNEATDGVSRFTANVSAFDTGDIKIPDITELVERASKGELTARNADVLGAASRNIADTIPGGASIVRGAEVEANAVKLLPEILNKARQSSPFGEEILPSAIEDAFRSALANGQNGSEVNAFIEQLGGVIEEIAAVENPNSNAAELLEPQNIQKFQEAIQGIQRNLPTLGNALGGQAQIGQALKASADRRLEIEQSYIDNLNSAADYRAQVEKDLAIIAGGGKDKRSLGQRNALEDDRLNNILSGTGFGSDADPRALAEAAINTKNALAQLEAQIASQGFASAGQISQYEKLRGNLTKFERAIQDTAESTTKYSNTLDELNKLESERTGRRNLALEFETADDAGRLEIGKQIAAMAKVTASGFDPALLASNPELKRQALEGFAKTEGTGIGLVDPRTGKKLEGADGQNEILKSLGYGPGVTSMGNIEQEKVNLLKQIANNTQRAREAQNVIQNANFDANGKPLGRHSGGSVPGIGNTDSVSALLTPGEFVMRKEAVSRIGLTNLSAMNSGRQRFAQGGLVQSNQTVNITGLDASVARFVAATNVLAQTLSTFPSEITGSFTVKHEHIFNGLEVLSKLEPSFKQMVEKLIEDRLQKFVDDKLPDLGRASGY